MKKLLIALLFTSWLIHVDAYAGKNPIAWTLSPTSGFPATTTVGSSYTVAYTMTNNLPFAKALTVSAAYNGGQYSMINGCNTTLLPNASCNVFFSIQPLSARTHSLTLTLAYDRNRVPLPTLSTNSVGNETAQRISGHVTQPLPPLAFVGGSYPVAFTFINNGDNNVTATAVKVSGFTVTSNTCLTPLINHTNCTVSGTFTPTQAGPATLAATYVYNGGSVALTTSTGVFSNSPNCHVVGSSAALPLPSSTYIYADNVVKFVFINYCLLTSEHLGLVTLSTDSTAGVAPTLTRGTDNCSGKTLSPSGTCSVYASVVPNATYNATKDLSVSAAVTYFNNTQVAQATTSEIVNALSNQATTHTLMLVNQCVNTNVWYEFQNGAGGNKSPDPTPANSRSFQNYQLDQQVPGAAPPTKTLFINEYINGAIYGRTGCNTSTGVCATANCPVIAGTGTCQTSVGATNPATIFESNLASTTASDGVYDISMVNGFNIPGEMRSLAPIVTPLDFTNACGQSSGALIQPVGSSLGACSWSFSPPNTGTDCTSGTSTDNPSNYYWVTGGADDGCTPGSCSAGQYCGMAYFGYLGNGEEGFVPINRRCGTFLGYWALSDWVNYTDGSNNWGSCNLYSHYGMGLDPNPGPNGSYGNSNLHAGATTFADMFACKPTTNDSLDSGYSHTKNVCGCYDWNQSGSVVKTAQQFNCIANNSQWRSHVFNRITWLKAACPTAYSYQFDDASTQFTCNISGQKTSYQLTYCPGGKTGAPGT